VVSFTYIGGLTIAFTVYTWLQGIIFMGNTFAWIITGIIWFLFALMLFKHRANIKRLCTHCENKVGFKEKLSKIFKKKDKENISEKEINEESSEKEIKENTDENQK